MSPKERSELRNIIKNYVSSNKGFSSRQIKNELKSRGLDVSAYDISKYLKSKFEKDTFNSDYISSSLVYNGIAFIVYHPNSETPNPADYFSIDSEIKKDDIEEKSQPKIEKTNSLDIVGFNFK